MTETEKKALALVNEVRVGCGDPPISMMDRDYYAQEALCRAIEQHEAFKREVSDAVEAVFTGYHDAPIPWVVMRRKLEPFIIAKTDPLVEVLTGMFFSSAPEDAKALRAAIEARGGRIVWEGE